MPNDNKLKILKFFSKKQTKNSETTVKDNDLKIVEMLSRKSKEKDYTINEDAFYQKSGIEYNDELIDKVVSYAKELTRIDNYKINISEKESLNIFDSKIGGVPYFDLCADVPCDDNGNKLIMLAQINFDKEKFDDVRLPLKGILQFWIDSNYIQNDCKNCKVIYHENVNYDISKDDILKLGIPTTLDSNRTHINSEYKMKFSASTEEISVNDYKYSDIMEYSFKKNCSNGNFYEFWDSCNEFNEIDDKFSLGNESKLLGYPFFCQYDPRPQKKDYDVLLFQICSCEKFNIVDGGVINVFINSKDLEEKNFTDVLFHVDFY